LGGRDRAREGRRQGPGADGRARQLRRAGGDRDADPRRALDGARRLHGRANTDGARRNRRGGREADRVARERGLLVLDRGHVRRRGREGGVLRRVRYRGPDGVHEAAVDDLPAEPLDPDTLELPPPYELLAPVEPPEVWCAGVTYERSRNARV